MESLYLSGDLSFGVGIDNKCRTGFFETIDFLIQIFSSSKRMSKADAGEMIFSVETVISAWSNSTDTGREAFKQ